MPEETKPPVPPAVPSAAVTAKPAAPAKVLTDAATKLSPQELVEKIRAELKMAQKQAATATNFGPGLPGKMKWRIPVFPRDWKMADLKTVNKNGKKVWLQGKSYELTYDEISDLAGRFSQRVRFELVARGQGPSEVNLQSTGHLF